MLRVACDIDDTLTHFIANLLVLYNEKYKDNLTVDYITDYKIAPFLSPNCGNLFKEFVTDEFMLGLKLVDGAKETLDYIYKNMGLYYVSAGHPKTAVARDKWLGNNFEWYQTKQLILCQDKKILNVDIMIDDHIDNLIGGKYVGLLMTRPWNKNFDASGYKYLYRVNNFEDVLDFIQNYEKRGCKI